MKEMISIPGALHNYFTQTEVACPFSPPRWIDLSHFPMETRPNTWYDPLFDEDDDLRRPSDVIRPLALIGYTDLDVIVLDRLDVRMQKSYDIIGCADAKILQ
jgi:hypothetical protein